jgi:hypothetical protein
MPSLAVGLEKISENSTFVPSKARTIAFGLS